MPTQPTPGCIETWQIERLVPYARNPRKNDPAVDRMCESIREFGFKIPCLVRSDGEIVDGHLRLKAARKLGITEIPVILCDEWTPAQVKAIQAPAWASGRDSEGTTPVDSNPGDQPGIWSGLSTSPMFADSEGYMAFLGCTTGLITIVCLILTAYRIQTVL